MDKASDDKMVNNLIALRKKALGIVQECFAGNPSFAQAVSQAFEFFINKRENKPAEMMGGSDSLLSERIGWALTRWVSLHSQVSRREA
jgi:hypothetical protein